MEKRHTRSNADRYTFRGNRAESRHGWLRLTPAYSVHLVQELLAKVPSGGRVLDPFCGTGTTLLTCAQAGIDCHTTDINPLLVWLARAKTRNYTKPQLVTAQATLAEMQASISRRSGKKPWQPPLHRIERWWDPHTLAALGRAFRTLDLARLAAPSRDLLLLAFCRVAIEASNASFKHQSMSFKKGIQMARARSQAEAFVRDGLATAYERIQSGATQRLPRAELRARLSDARTLKGLSDSAYTTVITSPPYPNRMSYIRELRPYMYWLGYLERKQEAGVLDWKAIGGTWGSATSNVAKWTPPDGVSVSYRGFSGIVDRIAASSDVLSRYVHKYFIDMELHARQLHRVVSRGGDVHFIVGNTKFYNELVPVERILARQFAAAGFSSPRVRKLRKRTSKKELFEYLVSASKS